MFPTPSKVTRLWLLPAVALTLMLLVYAVFAVNAAQAQTPAGDYCIEGIVIDWEEKPLAGWVITLTSDITGFIPISTTSPLQTDDDDDDHDFLKGEFEFADLDEFGAATYTATIESRVGWEGVTPTTITFPIGVGEDDCVQIRFKMRRIIPVTVIKIDANHDPLEDWKIKAVPGPGNLFASPDEEETDINGAAFFTLTPGVWIFMEMPPKPDEGDPDEGWMPVVPPSGRQEVDIDEDDDALTLVFKNELTTGCILVEKRGLTGNVEGQADSFNPVTDPEYKVAGWGFQLLRKDGSVAREGTTDGKGQIRFDGLPLGPYVLVEEDRPGWAETDAREVEIDVTGNQCADPIVFRNEQDDSGYCIEGYKVDANGGYGLADWEMKIEPLDEGGYDPDNVFTNGLGKFRFEFPMDDYRIPGAKYEICEEDKDGWLPHTKTCQTVQLPEWPGACVQLKDFVNQQVGHSESEDQHGGWHPGGGMDGASCSTYHVVKPGEGLYDIGRMYNKTPQQMLNANPDIKNSPHQWVIIGQKVCVP